MDTNKLLILALVCVSAPAWSRETTASPTACQAAAAEPAIANAKTALANTPGDLQAEFGLADAWSDAGCYNDAVQVLESTAATHPANKELETRLRVAKSLVGEEHFFDNLDRADNEAKLKRESFRCTTLADLDACNQALRLKPDDPTLLVAQGDALVRAKRPGDAVNRYRLAAVLAPGQRDLAPKIASAESQLAATPGSLATARGKTQPATETAGTEARATPAKFRVADAGATNKSVRRYTNAAPESRTH